MTRSSDPPGVGTSPAGSLSEGQGCDRVCGTETGEVLIGRGMRSRVELLPLASSSGTDCRAKTRRRGEGLRRSARRAENGRIRERFEDKIERLRRATSCPRASSRWSRSTSPSSASSQSVTRWPAATATRVSSPDPADRGHAVPRRRHSGRHRAQPAWRSVAYERRPDSRDPPRLGRAGLGVRSARC